MAKYSTDFKLKVVQDAAQNCLGARALSKIYGVNTSSLRYWIKCYQCHGKQAFVKKRRIHSAEFKYQVVMYRRNNQMSLRETTVYFNLGDGTNLVRNWEKLYDRGGLAALEPRPKGSVPKMKPLSHKKYSKHQAVNSSEELAALRKENEYLRAENDYLKKLDALLQQKVGDPLLNLKQRIKALYHQHKGRYGYRRITAALRQSGELVNHKKVQRLMQQLGLKSLVRIKKYRSYRGQEGQIAPHLLARQFSALAPNQKWVTDITEFNVAGKKLYLSPMMDLYNREIIAYEMSVHSRLKFVTQMLEKAKQCLKLTEKPLVHSDQGWHYQHRYYQQLLISHGLTQSMSRRGNCLDNAAMESFFGTLKSELYYLQKWQLVEQLKKAIAKYIDYYNNERIKLKLKGLSPVQYRTQTFNSL